MNRMICAAIAGVLISQPAYANSGNPLSTLLGLADTLLARPSASATAPEAKAGRYDVDQFDVAGMRLGMGPDEIRTAMVEAGFTPRQSDPTQASWEAKVQSEVAKRRPISVERSEVPMFTMASGTRGEHIEVWYYAGPDGPEAGSIRYTMPTDQMTKEAFLEAVHQKYGEPSAREVFCTPAETKCESFSSRRQTSMSFGSGHSFHTLYLATGVAAREQARDILAKTVEERAPKDARASF